LAPVQALSLSWRYNKRIGDLLRLPVQYDPKLSLTTRQLASHWRLSARAIEHYRKAGLPAEWRDGQWWFALGAAEQWRRDNRAPDPLLSMSDTGNGGGRPDERAPPPITT
jgi:hypothetical protein